MNIKNIALISTLRLNTKDDSILEEYSSKVEEKLLELKADMVICVDKYNTKESIELRERIIDVVSGKREYRQVSDVYTHLQAINHIRDIIVSEYSEGEIASFSIICPSTQLCKEMFLTTKHLASIVGYHKTEHDMYETIIDILRSMPHQGLSTSEEYTLGKFTFHSIHCDRPVDEVERQIFSTARELIGDRYVSIDKNYNEWRKGITNQ